MLKSLLTCALVAVAFTSATPAQTAHAAHRVGYYYQTQYSNNVYVSLAPIWQNLNPKTNKPYVNDLMVAMLHLGYNTDGTPYIHLNDNIPQDPMFTQMWQEVATLQSMGVPVRVAMGGAAQGSYQLLFSQWATFYPILKSTLQQYNLNGIDLDIEETVSLADAQMLIDQLAADFPGNFYITMAPVASALWGGANLSGFSYLQLAKSPEGAKVAWYNAQFYSGFATVSNTSDYERIIQTGFAPGKVVVGMIDNPADGSGFVPLKTAINTIEQLSAKYPAFGGVVGWEYFNAEPGAPSNPAQWATEFAVAIAKK